MGLLRIKNQFCIHFGAVVISMMYTLTCTRSCLNPRPKLGGHVDDQARIIMAITTKLVHLEVLVIHFCVRVSMI